MVQIKNIGHYQPINSDGYVVNTSSMGHLVSPWKEAVDELVGIYREKFGSALDSIYLRGSVAQGRAVIGISDIDTMVLLHSRYKEIVDLSWFESFAQGFVSHHPCVSDIEIRCAKVSDILQGDKYKNIRIQLTIYGLCVDGPNIITRLPQLKPGRDTIIHAPMIAINIQEGINKITDRKTAEGVKAGCRWMMKAFLRVGCELVMERERVYTRDIYPCYEVFAKYYPDQAKDMYRALDLALNPITDRKKLTRFINRFGGWLTSEVENQGLMVSLEATTDYLAKTIRLHNN